MRQLQRLMMLLPHSSTRPFRVALLLGCVVSFTPQLPSQASQPGLNSDEARVLRMILQAEVTVKFVNELADHSLEADRDLVCYRIGVLETGLGGLATILGRPNRLRDRVSSLSEELVSRVSVLPGFCGQKTAPSRYSNPISRGDGVYLKFELGMIANRMATLEKVLNSNPSLLE